MHALLAIVLIAAAVAAGAFFAGHPGHVAITWQDWQVETSVAVLAAALAVLLVVVAALVLLVAALRRVPRNLRRRRAARRRLAGEGAVTRGLVALAAGQPAEARHAARRAEMLLGATPVTLLLAAEAATRQGDAAAAGQAYSALLERPETAFLGLRGLLGQALRGGDDSAALRLAERAALLRTDAPWLAESLLALQARAGRWAEAHATLAAAARRRALPEERLRHHRGVVLHELSRAAERGGETRQAAALAARAQRLAPELAPVAAQHARLLMSAGRRRAAAKAIRRAWDVTPHPDLARLYLDLQPNAGAVARAAALQRLAASNPEAAESHLALAEAALAAELWGEARHHLGRAAAAGPASRRLCLLMARLEEGEGGTAAAARDWLDRALSAAPDARWMCARCPGESADWQPLCPACGAFDTLSWRRPEPGGAALLPAAGDAALPLMLPAAEVPGDGIAARPAAEPLGGGAAIG